jgi:hypothetical protein
MTNIITLADLQKIRDVYVMDDVPREYSHFIVKKIESVPRVTDENPHIPGAKKKMELSDGDVWIVKDFGDFDVYFGGFLRKDLVTPGKHTYQTLGNYGATSVIEQRISEFCYLHDLFKWMSHKRAVISGSFLTWLLMSKFDMKPEFRPRYLEVFYFMDQRESFPPESKWLPGVDLESEIVDCREIAGYRAQAVYERQIILPSCPAVGYSVPKSIPFRIIAMTAIQDNDLTLMEAMHTVAKSMELTILQNALVVLPDGRLVLHTGAPEDVLEMTLRSPEREPRRDIVDEWRRRGFHA